MIVSHNEELKWPGIRSKEHNLTYSEPYLQSTPVITNTTILLTTQNSTFTKFQISIPRESIACLDAEIWNSK